MDGISSAILNKIYALGGPGRYFIISEEEFFESFPQDMPRDGIELKKSLKTLASEGYVDIRYSDGDLYCVALLKTYVPEPPPTAPAETELTDGKNEGKTEHVSVFRAALAGGAIGGAIGSAVISLIFLLF